MHRCSPRSGAKQSTVSSSVINPLTRLRYRFVIASPLGDQTRHNNFLGDSQRWTHSLRSLPMQHLSIPNPDGTLLNLLWYQNTGRRGSQQLLPRWEGSKLVLFRCRCFHVKNLGIMHFNVHIQVMTSDCQWPTKLLDGKMRIHTQSTALNERIYRDRQERYVPILHLICANSRTPLNGRARIYVQTLSRSRRVRSHDVSFQTGAGSHGRYILKGMTYNFL